MGARANFIVRESIRWLHQSVCLVHMTTVSIQTASQSSRWLKTDKKKLINFPQGASTK